MPSPAINTLQVTLADNVAFIENTVSGKDYLIYVRLRSGVHIQKLCQVNPAACKAIRFEATLLWPPTWWPSFRCGIGYNQQHLSPAPPPNAGPSVLYSKAPLTLLSLGKRVKRRNPGKRGK